MKLVVCDRQTQGRLIIQQFGLNPEDFFIATPGSALAGRKFTEVIDLSHPPISRVENDRWLKWMLQLSTHLERKPQP